MWICRVTQGIQSGALQRPKGWGGEGSGREVHEGGDIGVPVADSCWCLAETNTIVCSVAQSCPTLCDPMDCSMQASLSFTISQSLLKLMSIESMMPSNHLLLGHPFLLLPSIFPSIRVFPNELAPCIRWPKYWSCSFRISPSSEYSGLISFGIDWLDFLTVQGTLKNLLQHHS